MSDETNPVPSRHASIVRLEALRAQGGRLYLREFTIRHPDEALDGVLALLDELERIRPVYEAACTWRDAGAWREGMCYRYFQESDAQDVNDGVASAVDLARSPR